MKLRARLGFTLLALAIAGGLVFGFYPRAASVETVVAAKGPLAVTVEEEGKTRVVERYLISAPVAGFARRIALRTGDEVSAGQVMAEIEPARSNALDPRTRAQAAAQVKASEAAVAAAREQARAAAAQADLARQEFERKTALRQSNFISEQALDQSRAELTRSAASKLAADYGARVAQFELDMARVALANVSHLQGAKMDETVKIQAPVNARVLKVVHESEGIVNAGESLLEIGNPESLEVEVEVLSAQAVKIAPGTKVLFERWGGETTLSGVVRVVEPAGFTKISALGVEEQRVRVIADFTSSREQWQRLGDGYRVEAKFVVWEGSDVLQIPASALFRYRNGWAAFVADAGHARLRPVEVGQRNGLQAEILSGLKVGEQVIARPDDNIGDGLRVAPIKNAESSDS